VVSFRGEIPKLKNTQLQETLTLIKEHMEMCEDFSCDIWFRVKGVFIMPLLQCFKKQIIIEQHTDPLQAFIKDSPNACVLQISNIVPIERLPPILNQKANLAFFNPNELNVTDSYASTFEHQISVLVDTQFEKRLFEA
jgi:hypothetical protein